MWMRRWGRSGGTSSVSNLSVRLGDSWQPFCVKISPQISLPWKGGWHSLCLETVNTGILRCVSEIWKRPRKKTEFKSCCTKHTLNAFHLLDLPAAVFLQFFNNSELGKGGIHVFCILSVCYLRTLYCNWHTRTFQDSHLLKLLGFYQQNGKSLRSWVTVQCCSCGVTKLEHELFPLEVFFPPVSHLVFITS